MIYCQIYGPYIKYKFQNIYIILMLYENGMKNNLSINMSEIYPNYAAEYEKITSKIFLTF
jgi:hypothetical protein